MSNEVTAIIVARKGSVRIKSKAMLDLDGETLIQRKIRQLKNCQCVDRIIFGSNCDLMLEHAHNLGVETIKRPDFYCDETKASANEMIENMCSYFNTDFVVWAHCTNPLLTSQTYDDAVQTFLKNRSKYDSLLSVVEFKEHLWNESKRPLNYNPYSPKHIPARDLPPYYMQDGGIFIQPYEQMLKNKYFFGKNPYLYIIPPDEFLDINNWHDYLLAKAIIDEKSKDKKLL